MGPKPIVILAVCVFVSVSFMLSHFATPVSLEVPKDWPEPSYNFEKNPLTQEGITLGRHLFYDPILSADSSTSCANCHLSYTAFTHVDHALSHGIHDSVGNRNSMALTNLAWSTSFMWDGAVNHLDMQALAPITDERELGSSLDAVLVKLKGSARYRKEFAAAFQDDAPSIELMLKALAQFQLTLISSNSKYDQVMRRATGIAFSPQEIRGKDLFESNCSSCHQPPLFTNGGFAINGLRPNSLLQDIGRMGITNEAADKYAFKVPSLRNIEYSKPYMHDGRFETLPEVLSHYASGIHTSPSLSPALTGGIRLTPNEQVDIIAFLLTLTDRSYLFNPKHAFPKDLLIPGKE